MVKHSRRNRKHKKNNSRRNIMLKNPKHRKKRATSFKKKPFNLRRSTLKKRQHGGTKGGQINTLRSLELHGSQSPGSTDGSHWTTINNPFIRKSNADYQALKDEVNTHQAELANGNNLNRRKRFNRISQNIGNLERQYNDNVTTGFRARLPLATKLPTHMTQEAPQPQLATTPSPQPSQGQVGVANPGPPLPVIAQQAIATPPANQGGPIGLGNAVAAQQQQQLAIATLAANQGGPAPQQAVTPAAINGPAPPPVGQQPPVVGRQGPVGVTAATLANARQLLRPVVAANPAVPTAVPTEDPVPQPEDPVPQPEQIITINITAPGGTIANLGGDAQLNQNNLAQVDIALADLVQNFAR